jgi:hypothetical protein
MGAVVVTGTTSVNYATSSDVRLKENIVDAPSAIDKVKETPPDKIYTIDIQDKTIFQSDFSKEDIIGATGTHEGTHATDKASNRNLGASPKQAEIAPNANELKFYQQADTEGNKIIDKK